MLTLFPFTAFAGGFTYGSAAVVGAFGQVGYLDVHQGSRAVYVSGRTRQVCIGRPTAPNTAPCSYNSICNLVAFTVPPPMDVANLPAKMSLPAAGPQVTDFAQDVQVGLLGVLRTRWTVQ